MCVYSTKTKPKQMCVCTRACVCVGLQGSTTLTLKTLTSWRACSSCGLENYQSPSYPRINSEPPPTPPPTHTHSLTPSLPLSPLTLPHTARIAWMRVRTRPGPWPLPARYPRSTEQSSPSSQPSSATSPPRRSGPRTRSQKKKRILSVAVATNVMPWPAKSCQTHLLIDVMCPNPRSDGG